MGGTESLLSNLKPLDLSAVRGQVRGQVTTTRSGRPRLKRVVHIRAERQAEVKKYRWGKALSWSGLAGCTLVALPLMILGFSVKIPELEVTGALTLFACSGLAMLGCCLHKGADVYIEETLEYPTLEVYRHGLPPGEQAGGGANQNQVRFDNETVVVNGHPVHLSVPTGDTSQGQSQGQGQGQSQGQGQPNEASQGPDGSPQHSAPSMDKQLRSILKTSEEKAQHNAADKAGKVERETPSPACLPPPPPSDVTRQQDAALRPEDVTLDTANHI